MRLTALSFAFAMNVFWMTCHPQVGQAQQEAPAAAPAVDAREAFRRGEAAYSAGNYELAIREWTNAYTVDPRPRIQFNLSQAYERMGDLEKAMDALRKFLDSGDPDDPMYSDANARLSALQQRMALTGVMVKGGAEGGLILVDDKDWGRTPRPDKISVAPGSHTLIVRWPSRPEFRTNVVVSAGQVIEVQIPADTSGAVAPVITPVASAEGDGSADSGGINKRLLWYGLGGGVAALGVGAIVYGVLRGSAVSDCGGTTYCDPDSKDSVKTQRNLGYGLGGALVAVGAGFIVLGVLTKSDSERQAKTQCGVGLASAACRFRF